MQGIKRWLIENGFKRRDLFAWPQGSFTASQMIIARRFFNAIRGTTGGSRRRQRAAGDLPARRQRAPADLGDRLQRDRGRPRSRAQPVQNPSSSWLILSFHEIVASGAAGGLQTDEATFKAMVEKIAASSLAVKTVAEVLES